MKSSNKAVEIKGTWGYGDQVIGSLVCLGEEPTIFDLKSEHQNQILALKGKLNRGLWHKAGGLGIKGIICGGLPDEAFAQEVEKEILEVEGEEKPVALPLLVIGEKDKIKEENWAILKKNEGKKIVVEGDKKRLLITEDET